MTIFPLLHKKVFKAPPVDQMEYHLSPTNMEVLMRLYEMRTSSVSELSGQLHISRPNMTPLVDKLVQFGLVDRKTSQEDRRVIQLDITEEGDRYCRNICQCFADQLRDKLESLEETDLTELNGCLSKFKTIIAKMN